MIDPTGSNWYRGSLLEKLHAIYHEATACSFVDAAAGRNHFKTIRAEIQELAAPGPLHLTLADSVQIVAADGDDRRTWLVDVGGPGGWVRLPRRLWRILETAIEQDCTLDEAIARAAPELDSDQRAQVGRSVTRLLARGLLARAGAAA